MSDPLSIAGGVVGVASLGIQVCHGLISYLRSVKGRQNEITGCLREVQSLIPIFYSLRDTLPALPLNPPIRSDAIHQCLGDSEQELRELQLLLLKLSGPGTSASFKGKAVEAGRSLVYPFHEPKLTSLRNKLQRLLDNLRLAIEAASLGSAVTSHERMDIIGNTVESLHANTQTVIDGNSDLQIQIRDISSGLQSLQLTVADRIQSLEEAVVGTVNGFGQQLAGTTRIIQDLDQNTRESSALVRTDIRSLASTSSLAVERFSEKQSAHMAQSSRMETQITQILDTVVENRRGSVIRSEISVVDASRTPPVTCRAPLKRNPGAPGVASATCSCLSKEPTRYSFGFRFGYFVFRFDQQKPPRHHRGCKLYGINKSAKRAIKAQFPVKMNWFANRITVAYIEHEDDPRMSVRLKNIVQSYRSPVYEEFDRLEHWLANKRRSIEETDQWLEATERAVLSLYRDNKASPNDLDEWGDGHATAFAVLWLCYAPYIKELHSEAAFRMLRTLVNVGELGDGMLDAHTMSFYPEDRPGHITGGERTMTRMILSYLADSFEIHPWGGLRYQLHSTPTSRSDLLTFMREVDIPPIFRAILSQSLEDLNSCIRHDPTAPMAVLGGRTTLQLSTIWPEGLRALLKTVVKNLVDYRDHSHYEGFIITGLTALEMAIANDSAESVGLLTAAGCHIPLDSKMLGNPGIARASPECTTAIASSLAERRRSLLELAQRELGILQHYDPSEVVDGEAAMICKALRAANIPIPLPLEVPLDYTTIYQSPHISIWRFPIFFESGFRDYKTRNSMGLTPVMTMDIELFQGDHNLRYLGELVEILPWLNEQGFLDENPEDLWELGLNTSVTGWHYLAAFLGAGFFNLRPTRVSSLNVWAPQAPKMVRQLSHIPVRDSCACLCNPEGKGCSPLKSLWKSRVAPRSCGYLGKGSARHFLFHYRINDPDGECGVQSNLALELVRYLTFDALEMTHTCCSLEHLSMDRTRPFASRRCTLHDCPPRDCQPHVIANPDPKSVRMAIHDDQEQEAAFRLDSLMEDFAGKIEKLGPSPKALEGFIWGYWRRRISELFVVDREVVDGMERVLENVRTGVLPKRLRSFFHSCNFDLLESSATESRNEGESKERGGTCPLEDIDVSRYCRFCDGGYECETWERDDWVAYEEWENRDGESILHTGEDDE